MRKKDSLTPQYRSHKFFFGYVIVFTAICLAIVLFGEGEGPDNDANLYWGLACMIFVLTIGTCLYSFFNKQIVDIRWEEEGLVFVSNGGKAHRVACEDVQEINSTAQPDMSLSCAGQKTVSLQAYVNGSLQKR